MGHLRAPLVQFARDEGQPFLYDVAGRVLDCWQQPGFREDIGDHLNDHCRLTEPPPIIELQERWTKQPAAENWHELRVSVKRFRYVFGSQVSEVTPG